MPSAARARNMKPSTKIGIWFFLGSALIWIGLFARPLGIPPDFEEVPFLAGMGFFYLGYRAGKKARAAGEIPAATDSQKQKKFRIMLITCAVGCAATPLLLPYMGVAFPFLEAVIVSVISFFMLAGAMWLT